MSPSPPDLPPASTTVYRLASTAPPDIAPFSEHEIRSAALRPHRIIELVLGERERLTETIASGKNLLLVAALLLAASVVFTLPYGAILGPHRALRVAALNLGSVAVCFPSLHVFSCYLGGRSRIEQTLVVALVVSAVAGMFVLGFAPIVWFVQLTTSGDSSAVAGVSLVLLASAVLAGVGHFARMFSEALSLGAAHKMLMLAWSGLLLFVVFRMGVFLELV